MGDSYGSHVLTALQRFIDTHNSYVAEHDARLKILEHRLDALEAKQATAQVPAVTVAECVKAMDEALGMLREGSSAWLILHNAIKIAKGGE